MASNTFMRVDDVANELDVSKSYAYKIVRKLNKELETATDIVNNDLIYA